jgi:transketolase
LVFADYMRPAIRLAALMELPVIYVFTHDSIWVGEDGPTHQPIEQVGSLRLIPGVTVLRPADTVETEAAWKAAIENTRGPVALILGRQGLPQLEATARLASANLKRGAYLLDPETTTTPNVVLLASGSEVHLIVEASQQLAAKGVNAQVVSMPSWELFAAQDRSYRDSVLPPGVPKIAIEAGTTMGWHRWVGDVGEVIGLDRFGASAPGKLVAQHLGLTAEAVVQRTLKVLERS